VHYNAMHYAITTSVNVVIVVCHLTDVFNCMLLLL